MPDPLPRESDESPSPPSSTPVERPSDPAAEFCQALDESLMRKRQRSLRRRLYILAAVLGAIALALLVWHQLTPPPVPKTVRELAAHYARKAGLSPHLVLGVIQVESAGKADAVSRSGARGLMQLMPATAKEFAKKHNIAYSGTGDLFDPDINLRLGTVYLAYLKRFFKDDLWLTLAAYNCGITRVDTLRLNNTGMTSQEIVETLTPGETQAYVPKVLAATEAERRRGAEAAAKP